MEYEFDIVWDCPLGDFLQMLKDFDLKLLHFIPNGPGGGNPCIQVFGTITNIQKLQSWLEN